MAERARVAVLKTRPETVLEDYQRLAELAGLALGRGLFYRDPSREIQRRMSERMDVLAGEFETRDKAETFGWDLVLEGTAEEFIVADGASRP